MSYRRLLPAMLAGMLGAASPAMAESAHRMTLAGRQIVLPVGGAICIVEPQSSMGRFFDRHMLRQPGRFRFLRLGRTCDAPVSVEALRAGQLDLLMWGVRLDAAGEIAASRLSPAELVAGVVREAAFRRPGSLVHRRVDDEGTEFVSSYRSFWQDEHGAYLNIRLQEIRPQAAPVEFCASAGIAMIRQIELVVTVQGGCDEVARGRHLSTARLHLARLTELNR
jgi:hypothetical protein